MSKPVFAFLDCEVFTARREIRRDGETLPVEPKVYDLILYLLERRDRDVSKQELQEAIWPGVIVTDSALTRCIMKARNLMGDDAKLQSVIKTVHSRGYRFAANALESAGDSKNTIGQQRPTERMTIAVLPFRNLSNQDEQNFLAEGLTQDIITDLSRNSWLMVVARASSANYTNVDTDLQTISSELGVQYIVEGSIRRLKDNIRVSASLTDVVSGASEWSERYDQSLEDFFEIENEISHSIASSLGSHVRRAEARRAARADPEALDVWGLLHRGMEISWSRFSRESNLEAESIYRKALALAPDNPRAMAFLAGSIGMKVSNGWSEDIEGDAAEAWKLGQRAVAVSPEDSMILNSFGHMNTCLGRHSDGVKILERAIEIDPSSAWGIGLLAFALVGCGRADEAIERINEVLRLSPRDAAVHWYLSMYSWAYLQLGHYEDAAREAQRSINSFAGWQVPWATLAVARAGMGEWDRAREAAEVAASLEPVVDDQGYSKFFRFIVRDETRGAEIAAWLQRVWPQGQSDS